MPVPQLQPHNPISFSTSKMLNPSLPVASRTRSRMEAYWSEVCPPSKRRNTRKKVVVQDPSPIPTKNHSGETQFLYEAPNIDIHRCKQDSRHPANISNLDYNDDDEEEEAEDDNDEDEDEDNDDSMEGSHEALPSPSEEDNDEPEDLDYCGEEEKDVVSINDYTSSGTESKPKSKGKKVGAASASSRKLYLLTVEADAILENVDSDSNKVLEVESENNSLPIKFGSWVENTVTPNNADIVDDEMESLWTEMQFCLASDGIASKPSLVEIEDAANVSEVKQDRAVLCCQGDHYLVLDEEIGIKCKFCSFLQLEIKYVASPFMKHPYGKFGRQYSGIVDSSMFDGLQDVDPNIDMPGCDSSANVEGTVWEIIPNIKEKLYPHQREGFEFIWNNIAGGIYRDKSKNSSSEGGGCIISHAPGTGKSLLTIVFLQTYLKENPSCRPVIVAPCSMLLTWEAEFSKWKVDIPFHNMNSPDFCGMGKTNGVALYEKLKVGVPDADRLVRPLVKLLSWKYDGGILVISYNLFTQLAGKEPKRKQKCKNLHKQVSKILLDLPGLLILDEGHIPRNAATLLWKALSGIKTNRRIILSGTPFQNNFDELFNTLCLVRPTFAEGIRYSNRYKHNSRRGCKGNEAKRNFTSWIGSIRNEIGGLREVRAVIKPFVHVYKGTILQTALPGLRHTLVVLRPTELQKKILERVEEILKHVQEILERVKEAKNLFKRKREREKKNALDFDRYVSMISIHPSLLKQLLKQLPDQKDINEVVSSIVSTEKIERIRLKPEEGVKTRFLMNLLKLSEALEERVIVFSQYLGPLRLIMEQLEYHFKWKEGEEILFMHGKCDIKQRQCSINVFNDPESKARVLLSSIKACSEGINLVGGSRVVLLDMTWNPSVERQAICRAYRLGQKKVVYVYRLISSVIEGHKFNRQAGKDRVSELLFSSDEHQEQVCDIVEDKVLEEMLQHGTIKSMFEKIINEPKDSEFIEDFEDQGKVSVPS
ncbi:SNF2 domain-containing protein CLASSY 3-like [Gossypium australe]|uniref:SNF2 domain-containing protein CLASSY 3-like n=1 Tax=Gossypium australe TaxID=47621 RepID=A0A5B6WYT8_9ROSI|nr:SNF2 domain-containing protein CLASSY 3-like [Gossypium australe]